MIKLRNNLATRTTQDKAKEIGGLHDTLVKLFQTDQLCLKPR
ncbi:hypothetical protein [Acetobacter syzygii]|nr:hypothetical protein [Acetobacter syzygii]